MGARILVVEDSPDIRILLQRALEFEGYAVLIATNGEEGLKELEQFHPDLVLLDLMMPVMDGYEFLDAKNQNPEISSVPVIVVSAIAGSPNLSGTIGFIKKPVDLNFMLHKIEEICGHPH